MSCFRRYQEVTSERWIDKRSSSVLWVNMRLAEPLAKAIPLKWGLLRTPRQENPLLLKSLINRTFTKTWCLNRYFPHVSYYMVSTKALKQIQKYINWLFPVCFLQIRREISTMKLINHPNVVRLYEVSLLAPTTILSVSCLWIKI